MRRRLILAGVLALASLAGSASADVTKANNNTNLNLGASWVGGVVPTGSDLMFVDGTMASDQTPNLGDNISILGISYSSTKILTVGNTAAKALTIGASGITMSAGRIVFNNAVTLAGNQSWSLGSARINVVGTLTTGGNTLSITGNPASATLALYGSNTYGPEVTIGTVQNLWVGPGPSGTVTINGTNNTATGFTIFEGTANIASMGNVNGASSIGKASASIRAKSTLNYTGNTDSSNKGMTRDTNSGVTLGDTTFNVTAAGQTLTMSGTFGHFGTTQTGAWIFGGDGNLTLSGVIQNGSGTRVIKTGAGTLTLSGTNTYASSTVVSNGVLLVNGAISTGAVTVASPGTLGGNGTIGGTSTVNGSISPGTGGIGTLTTSNVTWNAGVAWPYDLGDRLAINGSFTKGSGSGFAFNLQSNGVAGVYTLVTWSASTDFVAGDFAATNVPGGFTPTFTVNANELTLTLAAVGPSAGPVTLYRTSGQPLHLLASSLTTNSSNPGGGAVTTSWVSVTSSNGHPVYLSGPWVFYVPPANDNTTDYFNFRVANTNGVEAESTATILITSATTNTVNVSSVSISNNTATFQWAGLPGRTNMVDGATELGPVPAANWSNIGQVVVSGIGIGSFAETNPPSPRYYRIMDIVP